MRKRNYPTVALLALNFGTVEEEKALLEQFLNVPVKAVEGYCDGITEHSYVIPLPDSPCKTFKAKLVHLAQVYNQECFFVLMPPDALGKRRCISFNAEDFHHAKQEGYFVPCTQSQAYKKNGWTFDVSTGPHYILED